MIEIEDVIDPTPTNEDSKKISAIDRDTVHKICSGQVVLNLATAVKELVENSIDAGATVVEIKLKEQGAELVEVADNGSGVEEKNFEGLTAKYHTSKLKEFSDLASIATFGFRGEALSSLCALSDMAITTKHETAPHGIRLELDHRGTIVKRTPCARAVGTTVTLSNLFSTLPVRKKEFQKNIKREFIKMCQILQAYCLVSVGVRIICTNQNKQGVKSVIMRTQGTDSVLDNITTVFGAKQSLELLQLKPAISNSGKIMDLNESDFDDSLSLTQEEVDSLNLSRFTIDGYVSSCAHGSGRSSKDRQFFFVNSRPCEPKSIMKLVNETYHKYNANQNPFVYLNLKMDRSDVDINLAPDKRQILVNNEKILLLALKKSLLKTYEDIPSTFKMQNLDVSATTRLLNISVKSTDGGEDSLDESMETANPRRLLAAFGHRSAAAKSNGESSLEKMVAGKRKRDENGYTLKMHDFVSVNPKALSNGNGRVVLSDEESTEKLPKVARNSTLIENVLEENPTCPIDDEKEAKLMILNSSGIVGSSTPKASHSPEENVHLIRCRTEIPVDDRPKLKFEEISCNEIAPNATAPIRDAQFMMEISTPKREIGIKSPTKDFKVEVIELDQPSFRDSFQETTKKSLDIDMSSLKNLIDQEHQMAQQEASDRSASLSRLKFKSKINPSSNRSAEDELETEISKDKFAQMEIIGQFNLGFIIARLEQDLFIVDQHATDEKYNFEDLQRTTVLQNQKLVVPQQLELTAVNEMILMDNLEIFEMNGFKFEIDGSAEPTKKIKLVAKPFSKNWEFGKEDIDELIFMLQDAPNTVCRPSRVRAMFASRACRKSVMIGKALSMAEMKKLLSHMGEIEQPWNCPHGRPTMRHLVNLSMIKHGELTDQNVEQ
ncbi:mismatch repair endonuclease PMS2 [Ochlerotatus camptorhynchus]|uniref:mismatch repair endonuclease PMS2 n=1 Tax=Ochlerotatus camptorhynchus TaxID=644619 RepID=UPI0031D5EC6F